MCLDVMVLSTQKFMFSVYTVDVTNLWCRNSPSAAHLPPQSIPSLASSVEAVSAPML